MKTISLEFDNYILPLIAVLEKDIEHIETTIEILDQLRGMVIKRDDKSLNLLLEKVRIKNSQYANIEKRRQSIRKELARIWGCDEKEMTLTRMVQILPLEKSELIRQIRDKLETLLAKFRAEHLSTCMLLSECSRFNSELLTALLHGRQEESTYNRQGSIDRQSKDNFVNMKL